ncbi:DUF4349 domain-containing protein [Flavobacterium polysaccharolyticum]|uniref:DUF4349 domain-containing protein n=1 Tax=Flavobacterium polysaccharolyticum TaxID=3133148 RepID=A0ABU9NJY8_9FLAO
MKTIAKAGILAVIIAVALFSCKKAEVPAEETADYATAVADSATVSNTQEKTTETPKTVEKRKLIRTADIKFKVKSVVQSTNLIENTTKKWGGLVTYSNLQSTINDKISTKVSQDSTLETTKYKVENTITLRVPQQNMDTVVKEIAKEIDYLDYRLIKADDVALRLLSNELLQKRSATNEKRIANAIDTKGKKINDIMNAETQLENKKAQSDSSAIENLSLQDQINYSTITLQLYQREVVKQELVANEKQGYYFEPSIGIQILDALQSGWFHLLSLVVLLLKLWWLALIGLVIYWIFKKVPFIKNIK